jgi:hypothetical protein
MALVEIANGVRHLLVFKIDQSSYGICVFLALAFYNFLQTSHSMNCSSKTISTSSMVESQISNQISTSDETLDVLNYAQMQDLKGIGEGAEPQAVLHQRHISNLTDELEEKPPSQNGLGLNTTVNSHYQTSCPIEVPATIEFETHSAAMQAWMLEGTDKEPFNAVGEYLLVDMSQWVSSAKQHEWSLYDEAGSGENEESEVEVADNSVVKHD